MAIKENELFSSKIWLKISQITKFPQVDEKSQTNINEGNLEMHLCISEVAVTNMFSCG